MAQSKNGFTFEGVYYSLYETLSWAAFGRADAPYDSRSLMAWEKAERELAEGIGQKKIQLLAREDPQADHRPVDPLDLVDADFDPLSNQVYLRTDSNNPRTYIDVIFYETEVRGLWPDAFKEEAIDGSNDVLDGCTERYAAEPARAH